MNSFQFHLQHEFDPLTNKTTFLRRTCVLVQTIYCSGHAIEHKWRIARHCKCVCVCEREQEKVVSLEWNRIRNEWMPFGIDQARNNLKNRSNQIEPGDWCWPWDVATKWNVRVFVFFVFFLVYFSRESSRRNSFLSSQLTMKFVFHVSVRYFPSVERYSWRNNCEVCPAGLIRS
jgi:hypothetical protein